MLARARPYVLAQRAHALIRREEAKGCSTAICGHPVALEPRFEPFHQLTASAEVQTLSDSVEAKPIPAEALLRVRAWIPSDYEPNWRRSERFLKQLVATSHRIGFEIVGNDRQILFCFLCHADDIPVLSAAFYSEHVRCELSPLTYGPMDAVPAAAWSTLVFNDYLPSPPYSSLLTCPDELHVTPLESLLTTMCRIPSPALGVSQILLQAVHPTHNWHANIQELLDLEYTAGMLDGGSVSHRYPQQAPSGDLRQMAGQVETKAHNDKPIFAAAWRVAIVGGGESRGPMLRSLSTHTHLFQHGGRPLSALPHGVFRSALSTCQLREMFTRGLTYRTGFLVNSWELAGLVHLPPAMMADHRPMHIETLNTLPLRDGALGSGTSVGTCAYAGRTVPVRLPADVRKDHVHIVGRSGQGKTFLLEHMILDDVSAGAGVAVIDPHGDLIERLLDLLPETAIDRTVYFDPGDPDWVPIWNPFTRIPGQDLGQTADDLVSAFKSFVTGWGDRLERLLRECFYALLHLPGTSLLDVSTVLSNTSEDSKRICMRISEVISGEEPRRFWRDDFPKYRKDDLGPPKNKLSKLLIGERVPLIFSQPDSLFNLREIMDQGKILLVNLSTVGSDVRGVLGSLMLSLVYLSATSRSDTPADRRRPFHLYCDEAHRFLTDALDDLIAETRKYGVSLTLAHQYMAQFGHRRADALSSTGSTIVFNVNQKDASHLSHNLRGLIKPDDLINLKKFEAILRTGTDIIRIETPPYKPIEGRSNRDRIIAESHRRYYRRSTEVRRAIRTRHWGEQIPSPAGHDEQEFVYAEL